MSGHPESDYGRVSYIDEFADSHNLVVDGDARAPYTYSTDEPERRQQNRQRLDYCFASAELAEYVHTAYADTDARGSGHFPYWMEIDL